VDAFYEWRELIEHSRGYDARDDQDYDSDRGYNWESRSWDSDATYIRWRGCHMQDEFRPICVSTGATGAPAHAANLGLQKTV